MAISRMYDPYNYDRGMGGEPEIIEERTSEVSMYQPIGPKTAASVLIRNAILNFRPISPTLRGAVILGKDHVLSGTGFFQTKCLIWAVYFNDLPHL